MLLQIILSVRIQIPDNQLLEIIYYWKLTSLVFRWLDQMNTRLALRSWSEFYWYLKQLTPNQLLLPEYRSEIRMQRDTIWISKKLDNPAHATIWMPDESNIWLPPVQ